MSGLHRRALLLGLSASALTACETVDPQMIGDIAGILGSAGLTEGEAADGIRAALINGTGYAVDLLGQAGGYLLDNVVHIPLPRQLADLQSTLSQFGMSGILDELETQLNRGAETAAPIAKDIFVDVISGLTVQDAINIVQGADDAATTYLRDRTLPRLTQLFRPVMENALSQTGALQTFDQLSSQLQNVPFAPQLGAQAKDDLYAHGVEYALSGMFHYIAREEAAIRSDPAKRTSEILRRVFGYV